MYQHRTYCHGFSSLVTVAVTRIWGLSAVSLSTIVTTIVVFFAGEMLPKSIAKRYSERCALATAPSLCFFMRIFAPLAKALSHIGEFFSNLAKGEPEITVTEDYFESKSKNSAFLGETLMGVASDVFVDGKRTLANGVVAQ